MMGNAVYNFVVINLLQKFLLEHKLLEEGANMDLEFKKKRRELTVFWVDVFLSGLMIHAAAFFIYFWLTGFPPFWAFIPLTFSYGVFHHYFLNWLPKAKKTGVNFIDRREKNQGK